MRKPFFILVNLIRLDTDPIFFSQGSDPGCPLQPDPQPCSILDVSSGRVELRMFEHSEIIFSLMYERQREREGERERKRDELTAEESASSFLREMERDRDIVVRPEKKIKIVFCLNFIILLQQQKIFGDDLPILLYAKGNGKKKYFLKGKGLATKKKYLFLKP